MQYIIQHISQIPTVAQLFVKDLILDPSGKLKHKKFAFSGEMGMGKTTLIVQILKVLGIKDANGSPTYSLVNEYRSEKHGKIYHIDAYRIESEIEAYQSGIEEILFENAICFVEWPEKVKNILSSEFLWVHLKQDERGFRNVNVKL